MKGNNRRKTEIMLKERLKNVMHKDTKANQRVTHSQKGIGRNIKGNEG